MRDQIVESMPVEFLEYREAQHDQDRENQIGGIQAREAVEEEPDQIEERPGAPVPMTIAQRDDVTAQREEDRHADAGGPRPSLDGLRQHGGWRHACPKPVVRDDDQQGGKSPQTCQ